MLPHSCISHLPCHALKTTRVGSTGSCGASPPAPVGQISVWAGNQGETRTGDEWLMCPGYPGYRLPRRRRVLTALPLHVKQPLLKMDYKDGATTPWKVAITQVLAASHGVVAPSSYVVEKWATSHGVVVLSSYAVGRVSGSVGTRAARSLVWTSCSDDSERETNKKSLTDNGDTWRNIDTIQSACLFSLIFLTDISRGRMKKSKFLRLIPRHGDRESKKTNSEAKIR